MRSFDRANVILGLGIVCFAIFTALIWIPMDTATGMIEKVRRQVTIGDALAPTVACGFLILGGLIVALFERPENSRSLTSSNLRFIAMFLAIMAGSFIIMRWLGPLTAEALSLGEYRLLRDTRPWKYLGFLVGAAGMIAGLAAMIEGRITLRGILVGLMTVALLILVYDLPFDNLLLPPNGDV